MGFQVNCDRCGRFMKNVNGRDLKGMMDKEIVCKVCVKTEDKIVADLDKLKRQADVEVKKVTNAYKTLLIETIQEQVAKNYASTTG
jgi:hypothetical protein